MKKDMKLLHECRESWDRLADFRSRRQRCVDFACGRQWGDRLRMADGRIRGEADHWVESGRMPVANNLIRRLIKTTIGEYRSMTSGADGDLTSQVLGSSGQREQHLWNCDSRSLEEFMISGLAVQRIELDEDGFTVSQRSPDRLFFHRFLDPEGADCRFLGLLHDLTLTEILRNFGDSSVSRVKTLFEVFSRGSNSEGSPMSRSRTEFDRTDTPDRHRVIEVWSKRSDTVMHIADRLSGKVYSGLFSEETVQNVDEFNRVRREKGEPELLTGVEIDDTWEEKWLTPEGLVLREEVHLPGINPPILMQAYPMIDGESRSPVEDLLDQQKYINRLVMLVDDVLSASAKGVVLYPTDQLPEGLTWQDLRKIWSSPSGILPYKRTSKSIMPQQINNSGSFSGAVDMLRTQLTLFDEIAGLSGHSRESDSRVLGAEMMRQQREKMLVSMLDLLSGFHSFTCRRDRHIARLRGEEEKGGGK